MAEVPICDAGCSWGAPEMKERDVEREKQDDGEDLLSVLEQVTHFCENRGAESEVYGIRKRETIISLERNDINHCTQQFITGMGIRACSGNQLGFACCNSIDSREVKKTAEKAIKMSRKTPPSPESIVFASPHRIPIIEGLYNGEIESFDAADAVKEARKMMEVLSEFRQISLDNGEFFVSREERAISSSHGISSSEYIGGFCWYLVAMAQEGGEVGSYEYEYGCTTQVKDINVEESARAVVEKALRNLHPRTCESFTGDVILGPEAVSTLVGDTVAFAVNATNVHMGQSALSGCRGQNIAADILTIKDDSTLPFTYNSSSFDREGTPHQAVTIVEKGVLNQFLYHTQSAFRDGIQSTGNATGSFAEMPRIDITHLIIEPSTTPLVRLIEETEKGLLISRFGGSGEDVSGVFSGGLKGSHLIESGEITHPVKGLTLQGNIFDILPNVCDVSSETARYPHMTLPSMKIENMHFIS